MSSIKDKLPETSTIRHWFSSANTDKVTQGLLITYVLIAISVYIIQFNFNRSLWLDETYIAENIAARSFTELLQPLDYNQAAPIFFLLLSKLSTNIFGLHEMAFRLIPLMGAFLAIGAIIWTNRQILSPYASLLIFGIFAFNTNVLYYATEFKQYIYDIAFIVIILRLYISYAFHKSHYKALIITGALSVYFSHPVNFMLAATGLSLLIPALLKKDKTELKKLSLMGVIWVGSIGLNYFLFLKVSSQNNALNSYWLKEGAFMPVPPTWAWLSKFFYQYYDWCFRQKGVSGFINTFVDYTLIGSFFLGITFYFRKNLKYFAPFALLFLIALTVSALELYPLKKRMLLFLLPISLYVIGRTLDLAFFKNARINHLMKLGILIIFMIMPTKAAIKNCFKPREVEEIRSAIQYIQQKSAPNDTLYIYHGAVSGYRFYQRRFPIHVANTIWAGKRDAKLEDFIKDVNLPEQNGRLWVLFSHVRWGQGAKDFQAIDSMLSENRIDELHVTGAKAVLYDLSSITDVK